MIYEYTIMIRHMIRHMIYNLSCAITGQYMCMAINDKDHCTQYLILNVKSKGINFIIILYNYRLLMRLPGTILTASGIV